MRLPLRYELGLTLFTLSLAGSIVTGTVLYRSARSTLEAQALRTVGTLADARAREAGDVLAERQRRFETFLEGLESLCGERGRSGRLGWEDECVGVALGSLQGAEAALDLQLEYDGRPLARFGWSPQGIEVPPVGELARFRVQGGGGDYTMRAVRDRLELRARLAVDDLETILRDRSGLSSGGEAFLANAGGYRITRHRHSVPDLFPAVPVPMAGCATDDVEARPIRARGMDVLVAERQLPGTGGACVVAALSVNDALAPVTRLTSLFVTLSAAVVLLLAAAAVFAAGVATRPIRRLVAASRAIADGEFDARVPIGGPSDVRQLGQALAVMARSIGDVVRAERHAREHAEEENHTKDRFLATVSHELRNPLTAILGWAAILNRGDVDQARRARGLDVIARSARAQTRLVDDLLDVSRSTTGRLDLAFTDVAIAMPIQNAVDAMVPVADGKGVELSLDNVAPTVLVRADAQRIQQVVLNLLANAVRYTEPGGRVSVVGRVQNGVVVVRVRDTGQGIDPELLPHVFEAFRQGARTTERDYLGLGLGLAIARHIVERHGGTIVAESDGAGRGSTFTVSIPIRPAAGKAPGAPAADRAGGYRTARSA